MSPTPSIPEEEEPIFTGEENIRDSPTPSQTSSNDDAANSDPPLHPVPSMQGAFEESMYEQGLPPPSPTNPYAVATTISNGIPPPFKPKYHFLTKLISQITFGMHLLHKRLAKSDSEVVRILQAHVNDMDHFLSTTTHEFDLARSDISARIKNLKVPLESGPASDVFENMLREPGFRAQIMEGNKTVEQVVKRTAKSMNRALEDIGEGLKAVDELAKYLVMLKTGWRNANLQRVYAAMTHNVEGWFRCFVGLQMKGQGLGERLNTLKMVVWEIERRCGRASRGGWRSSLAVVKKRPSLNQIPENPAGEHADSVTASPSAGKSLRPKTTIDTKASEEKPLPTTPVPTPIRVTVPKDALQKRHSYMGGIASPPATPRRVLSKKRRSVSNPQDLLKEKEKEQDRVKEESEHSQVALQTAERTVETIVILDHEKGSLRRKRIHRRSATVHGAAGIVAADVSGLDKPARDLPLTPREEDTSTAGSGVLSSLRRSLSLGRSGGRARSQDRSASGDEPSGSRGKSTASDPAPPVPKMPASVQEEIQKMAQKSTDQAEHTKQEGADTNVVAADATETERPKSSGVSVGVADAVKSGIASLTKRRSKAHLHHPSGQFYMSGTRASSDSQEAASTPSVPPVPKLPKQNSTVPDMPVPGQVRRTKTEPSEVPTTAASKGGQLRSEKSKTSKPKPAPLVPPSTLPIRQSAAPKTPTTPSAKASRRNSTAAQLSNFLSLRPRSRHGTVPSAEVPPPLPSTKLVKSQYSVTTNIASTSNHNMRLTAKDKTGKRIGEGSAILASVRELNNAKAGPAFKLQGIDSETPVPPRKFREQSVPERLQQTSQPVLTQASSSTAKKAPAIPETTTGGKGKGFFLVKFFTERSF